MEIVLSRLASNELEDQTSALASIRAITVCVPDVEAAAEQYARWLGYAVTYLGPLGDAQANTWSMPRLSPRPTARLRPASGADVDLQLVGTAAGETVLPHSTLGWNGIEMLVADVDAVHRQLQGSPFQILGAPKPLSVSPHIRAMQVVGPGGELLFLTQVDDAALGLGTPRSMIDRIFMVTCGTHNMQAHVDLYRQLGCKIEPARMVCMPALNSVYGLPPQSEHRLALARLAEPCMLEIDQYPPAAEPRRCAPGDLPPGIAMVSFAQISLVKVGGASQTRHRPRSTLLRGPAGEWLELLATGEAIATHA